MNTFIKKLLPIVLLLSVHLFSYGQMIYIGLKDEANVRVAQNLLFINNVFGTYWPKTQIIDDYLYVPTINGIYRKDLNILNTINWELYAFEGIPVRDFIKNNDTIMAATAVWSDKNILLLSTNDGLTYKDCTPVSFLNPNLDNKATVLRISQNPHNHNTIAALYAGNGGVALSSNFGLDWTISNYFIGGYQDRFIDFNPNDTTNIFYAGEQILEQSYIRATYDNGDTWATVDFLQSHCTHGIAFHPFNKDIMISYGEGRLAKSMDQGKSWIVVGYLPMYIYKVIYDQGNPNILYASGSYQGEYDFVEIYRSIDGGDSWHLFHKDSNKYCDGVMDIHLYNGKLMIYMLIDGIFYLDLDTNLTTYTVTFACEEISIKPQLVEYGDLIIRPEDPERENYNFLGWFTDNETFNNEWNFVTDIVIQDTTLYAKWEQITGISEIESVSIEIYPNPVKDELQIESGELRINRVEIVDVAGKIIYQFSNLRNPINVSALSQGIYFLRINGKTVKFVKE